MQSNSEQHLEELERTREQVSRLRGTLADVSDRLARGIEENESLYRRVRELEGRSVPINASIRDSRARSLDSLSDLTNIDLDLDTENMDKERFVFSKIKICFILFYEFLILLQLLLFSGLLKNMKIYAVDLKKLFKKSEL